LERVQDRNGRRTANDATTKRGDVTTTLARSAPLTAQDRCDRCGAQAYIRVRMVSGGELLFCAHHSRKYEEGLRKVAVDIHDESGRLGRTPPIAPLDER
jgi:hypothetical protein